MLVNFPHQFSFNYCNSVTKEHFVRTNNDVNQYVPNRITIFFTFENDFLFYSQNLVMHGDVNTIKCNVPSCGNNI